MPPDKAECRPGARDGIPDEAQGGANVPASIAASTDPRAERCRAEFTAAREYNRRRRAGVLRYPDLAGRLTQLPFTYGWPEQWNGYVPPELRNERRNQSPQRAALAEICGQAASREQERRRQ